MPDHNTTLKNAHDWIWNPDFIIHQSDSHQLILKNDSDGALILLSRLEYELLQAYASDNDLSRLPLRFPDAVWEESTFNRLLEQAKKLSLLQPRSQSPDGSSKRRDSGSSLMRRHPRLYYLGVRSVQILQKITGWRLTAEFNGHLRFFKWFSIDLEGSLLQKAAERPQIRKAVWICWLVTLLFLAGLPVFHPAAELRFSGFAMEHYPVGLLFLCIVVSIFFCLFIHECGHYFVFKAFGGRNDRMGLGCMFLVFPVLYTQIDQIHLWTQRRQRMLLSSAGMLADIWMWLIITNLLCFYHHSDFFSLICSCLFYYYGVQMLSNLNFLLPGTDGYYLLEDAVGADRLFGNAYECTRDCLRKSGDRHKDDRFKALKISYFCSSCLCISLYWLALSLLLTFPLWSNCFLL